MLRSGTTAAKERIPPAVASFEVSRFGPVRGLSSASGSKMGAWILGSSFTVTGDRCSRRVLRSMKTEDLGIHRACSNC